MSIRPFTVRKETLRRYGLILKSGVRPPVPSTPKALSSQLDRNLAEVV